MNVLKSLLLVPLIGILVPAGAWARLNVVTSTPDLAALAEAVGGDRVSVTSLSRPTEDPHSVTSRPSYTRLLNRADVLIEGGAELEVAWLPPLVRNARNREILSGRPGHIEAAEFVQLLDVPSGPIDRSMGDVHAAGNPHFLLDPRNAQRVAKGIAARFRELDPEGAEGYARNLERFLERVDERMEEWRKLLRPYEGTAVVTYHKNYDYFARRFGFEMVGQIEPLPGIAPSPRHLASLIASMREEKVPMIWVEPFRPRRAPSRVAEETRARLVFLPEMPGAVKGADDYVSLIDHNVSQIAKAMDRAGPRHE